MANIKEKDLPVASEIASTDYLRMVDGSGASKRVQVNTIAWDYVVETGITNGWVWQKYNSGRAQAFVTHSGNWAVNTSAPAYGGYRSALINMPAFPFSFKSGTSPTAVATVTGGSAQGAWVNHVEVSATAGSFYLSCGASLSASTRSISIFMFGWWK